MSEHILPDDHSRWPTNPFELLGVSRGASQQDIRRAYTRLIRTYKPEQFPDQFRRIRDAYEAAQQRATFFINFTSPPANSPPARAEDPPAPQPTPAKFDTDNSNRPSAARPAPRSLEQELDEAWNWAIDGDEPRAYSSLLELQKRFPHRSEVCVRLYSLLSVAPELDARRAPGEFLLQGLLLASGDGAIRELYRREIETNPDEALSDRFVKLLGATAQPAQLANYARWRWSAAGRQRRLDVLADDLPVLRAQLAVDHEEIWLRLLVSAAEHLAWGTIAHDFEECCSEVARHDHLQLRCVEVFNRLEYLEHVAAEWQLLRTNGTAPDDLLTLLSRYWTRPFEELRREMATIVAAIAAKPQAWLAKLDAMNATAPHLVSVFGQMLESYRGTLQLPDDPRDPEALKGFVRDFLDERGGLSIAAIRPLLIVFCVRELIHPELIAEVTKVRVGAQNQILHNHLVSDRPLRYAYRAAYLGQF